MVNPTIRPAEFRRTNPCDVHSIVSPRKGRYIYKPVTDVRKRSTSIYGSKKKVMPGKQERTAKILHGIALEKMDITVPTYELFAIGGVYCNIKQSSNDT